MIKKLSIILLSLLMVAIAATAVTLGLVAGKNENEGSAPDTEQSGGSATGSETDGNGTGNGSTDGTDKPNGGDNTNNGTDGSDKPSDGADNKPDGGNTGNGPTDGVEKPDDGDNTGTPGTHTCNFVISSEVEVDCVTDGYKLFTCNVPGCGKTEKRDKVKALGHDKKDKIYKETCISDWYMVTTCTRCSFSETKVVEGTKIDCIYDWTETKAPTCTTAGAKTGVCNMCGKSVSDVVPALDHNFVDYVSNGDEDCTRDGTETAECTRCTATDTRSVSGTRLPHSYGEYIPDNNATCFQRGTMTATCASCGDKRSIIDPSAGGGSHNWQISSTVEGADCKEQAVITKTCKACGESEVEYGEYGRHKISNGKCTVCGKIFGDQNNRFDLDIIVGKDAVSDFGTVYLEFIVLSHTDTLMVYDLYIVQEYTVNGKKQTVRNKIVLPAPDDKNCGFYSFTLFSVKHNEDVGFSGWIDYDVYKNDNGGTFIVGGNSNTYSYIFGTRYYLTF